MHLFTKLLCVLWTLWNLIPLLKSWPGNQYHIGYRTGYTLLCLVKPLQDSLTVHSLWLLNGITTKDGNELPHFPNVSKSCQNNWQDRAMLQTRKINNLPTTQHIQNVSCDKLRLFTPLVVLLIMYTSNIDLTCITLARQVNCSFLVT